MNIYLLLRKTGDNNLDRTTDAKVISALTRRKGKSGRQKSGGMLGEDEQPGSKAFL